LKKEAEIMSHKFNHKGKNIEESVGISQADYQKEMKLLETELQKVNGGKGATRSEYIEALYNLMKKDDKKLLIIVITFVNEQFARMESFQHMLGALMADAPGSMPPGGTPIIGGGK
jgi:hypothetical protein